MSEYNGKHLLRQRLANDLRHMTTELSGGIQRQTAWGRPMMDIVQTLRVMYKMPGVSTYKC